MNYFDKEKIAKIMREKKALMPCSRCGNTKFTLSDGYTNFSLNNDTDQIGSIVIGGGQTMPVVLIVCNNCGAITPHALFALIPPPPKEKKPTEVNGNGK